MNDFDDNMLERDLAEVLGNDGPAPELKDRILDATRTGRRATRRPSGRGRHRHRCG